MNEFEILSTLLKADRSIRRFNESKPVAHDDLSRLVNLTRYCSSGRNLQPLRYRAVSGSSECVKVFPILAWAGYLKDWPGPEPGERPTAYLVQCLDTRLAHDCLCDDGLQLQAITLGARALGIGCCILKAFNVEKMHEALELPNYLKPRYVVALGYPVEKVVVDDMDGSIDADYKYWREADGTHHVPKRPLSELMI